MMNVKLRIFLLALVCLMLSPVSISGELLKKTFNAKSYNGSRNRHYQVFVPSTYRGDQPVPMVMVLHGCKQTEQNMVNETRFKELAEQENFIVVYPFITSYDGSRNTNCWGFWLDQHIHQGAGETEDLRQIGMEVEARYKIDPERRYITGLSSGAAMSVVMAVAHSEYFAAAGAAAGLPYGETSSSVGFVCANPGTFKPVAAAVAAMKAEQKTPNERRIVPLMTMHSLYDCTVNKKGSENIRDAWLQLHNTSATPVETKNCSREGVTCTHKKYGSPNRSVVETLFYEGAKHDPVGTGSHYWVGDNPGEYANPNGPSATELFWDFFKRHTFSGARPPTVAITSDTVSGTSIMLAGTASDPDGAVTEVSARLEGERPQASRSASGTSSWSVAFDNLPNNTLYTPVVTAKDNQGATTSVTGRALVVGAVASQPPALTVDAVTVNGNCIAVTGSATDDGTVAKVEVELAARGFKAANFSGTQYRYRECGLPSETYATKVSAVDNGGAVTTVTGPIAKVENLEVVTANWLDHMHAGRLRTYTAPCASVGFGACDVGFQTIFLTHSFNSFALYKAPTSPHWYTDPANIGAAVR